MHFNFVRKSYLLSQSFAEINALCFFADVDRETLLDLPLPLILLVQAVCSFAWIPEIHINR